MEATLQRIIRKLELNENAVSTIIGGLVLLIVAVLFINYFSQSEIKQNSVTESLPVENQTAPENLPGETSSAATSRYTVAANDTLWSIAESTYGDGYMWTEIARVNNMLNPDTITVGTSLDLPRKADIEQNVYTSSGPETIDSTSATDTDTQVSEYTVQRGDYLWSIAETIYNDGYRWTDIWQANQQQIPNPNILVVGLTLTIPS